jgi:hypothetical protein
MAVVINEVETTVAPPSSPSAGQSAQAKQGDSKGDAVKEVVKKLHVMEERARRLWAY